MQFSEAGGNGPGLKFLAHSAVWIAFTKSTHVSRYSHGTPSMAATYHPARSQVVIAIKQRQCSATEHAAREVESCFTRAPS